MDILIFSGQSNMQGQTDVCPPADLVEGACEYRFLTNETVPLSHPVGEDIGNGLLLAAHEGHGSLIPAFCRAYRAGCGEDVLAVHAARGSTMVSEWLPETDRYAALLDKVRAAIQTVDRGQIGRIYIVWLQGESDAIYEVKQAEYEDRLRTLRAALFHDLPLDGFGIIRVGKFVRDARDLEIIRAQEDLCTTNDFRMLTRVTGICTEDAQYLNPYVPGHYNNAGMDLIGSRAGTNLARIRMGLSPVLEDEPYEDMRI